MLKNTKIPKRIILAACIWLVLMIYVATLDGITLSLLYFVGIAYAIIFIFPAWFSIKIQEYFKEQKELHNNKAHKSTHSFSNPVDTQFSPIQEESEEILAKAVEADEKTIGYDAMDGHDFERFCADILSQNGFNDVEITKSSGDQGIDVIAFKDGMKYGIQCKRYSNTVGNKAVQEVFSGKTFYGCHVGVVLTNQYFTPSAIELANTNGVLLWDRNKLDELIENVNPPLKGRPIKPRLKEEINMDKKKYCKFCGELIDIDCVVCPKCGKQVEVLVTDERRNRRDDRPIIINASASSSSSAYVNNGYRRKLPWYLRWFWIFLFGCMTGGIYWIVGLIMRSNWKSHN